jgi:ABC-type phosphate transport system substrate-binding protein
MRTTAAKLATVAAATALSLAAAAGSATADPTVVPSATDIVGVASYTTQGVMTQLAADYDAQGYTPRLYVWDATGPSPITPKSGAATIARPNGDAAEIAALNSTTSTTLDFATVTRGPRPSDPSTDYFVAMAKDGVSWAANASGYAPANLTTPDLAGIYTCTITNWNQITDVPGYTGPNATIDAYLPAPSSETRTDLLAALGGGTPITPGACVESYAPQQDEGTDPVFADPNALVPYTAAHYIGQVFGGHTTATDAPGPLTLRSVDGLDPITAFNTLNASFTATAYGRTVYNVIRSSEWNPELQGIFGSSGWICTNATARADIASYGFEVLSPGACGSVTHS